MYNKYRNIKTEIDGIKFDSKKEAKRYTELKLMEKSGLVKSLYLQPKYLLQESFVFNNEKHRSITYTADFEYKNERGNIIIEDVKGMKTDVYKIKKKMLLNILKDLGKEYYFIEI